METIERTEFEPMVRTRVDRPTDGPRARRQWPYRLWRGTVAFLSVATIAFGVAGLIALRNTAAAGWRDAFQNFKWAVLVTGEAVELDEIGRYLKELDGVAQVTLIPGNAIIDRLRREPLLENHLAPLNAAKLPSIWQVSWTDALDLDSLEETATDLKRLPGVVDIAWEQRNVDQIRYFRGLWYSVRLALSGIALLGTLLGAVLLGRFLFFTNLSALRLGRSAEIVLVAGVAWLAGLAMARGLVGSFSWHLAWGGLAAGLARLAASHTRRFE